VQRRHDDHPPCDVFARATIRQGAKDSLRRRLGVPPDAATIRPEGPHLQRGSRTHLTPHLPELDRPPFAVLAALGPTQVAQELVACFHRLGARPDRLEHAHALALHATLDRESGLQPLAAAGRAIARDIDRGVGAGVASGYHNPQHFLEVMLCALYLARLHDLAPRRVARLVTAGLVHDFHHDGSRGASAPFRLELLAVEKATPYLQASAVDSQECARLEALVLATEPRAGVPFARACWREHQGAVSSARHSQALPPALERIAREPELAFEAVLLAEADVLPSIGLTYDHAESLQARLAAEWRMPLGHADKLQFIDRMLGEISVAQFFVPNVKELKQGYAAHAAADRGASRGS
jgi:hypothetical protein